MRNARRGSSLTEISFKLAKQRNEQAIHKDEQRKTGIIKRIECVLFVVGDVVLFLPRLCLQSYLYYI